MSRSSAYNILLILPLKRLSGTRTTFYISTKDPCGLILVLLIDGVRARQRQALPSLIDLPWNLCGNLNVKVMLHIDFSSCAKGYHFVSNRLVINIVYAPLSTITPQFIHFSGPYIQIHAQSHGTYHVQNFFDLQIFDLDGQYISV